MSKQEALGKLRVPLKFGDETQIRSVRFLAEVGRAMDAIRDCPQQHKHGKKCLACNGTGETRCNCCDHDVTCGECDGTGKGGVGCKCIRAFSIDIREATADEEQVRA